MKLPISYYGGKQKLAKKILPLIPDHRIYVEPYAGGAAVFFAKKPPSSSGYIEVLNDHDKRLVNFYKVLQNPVQAYRLYTRLAFCPYSRQLHMEAKDFDKDPRFDDPVEAAYHYFIEITCSFSNKLGGGWSTTTHTNSSTARTMRHKIEVLEKFVERMRYVYVDNLDSLQIIEKWDTPETFFYVDPPYPGADQGHYRGFSAHDFERLVDKLNGIKGKFLLSNYDQPGIPGSWTRHEFDVLTTAAKNRPMKRKEIVWAG